MQEFRLIVETDFNPAAKNMAIDEAIMLSAKKTGKPTVRFYGWAPPAISIGYFQGIEQEVDLQKCKEFGVDFVRRITGGGAVFHDKELTYSFSCSEQSAIVSKKIIDSYKKICNPTILGLKHLGLEANFAPLNDIIVNGKKISGNAQTRRDGAILQHGTILMEVDVEKMFSLLKVSNEKLKGKLIEDVKQRVTSVEQQLGKKVSFQKLAGALKKGFEQEFSATLSKEKLSKEETGLAEKIMQEKFLTKEWNFKR
ncbi:MAG: lipoate--protein ligase family protein [Candidatus Diapherotrites archaeon]|nr:lipoate--protein ligase family protein [Candidatus Diapherotrites archaeon]